MAVPGGTQSVPAARRLTNRPTVRYVTFVKPAGTRRRPAIAINDAPVGPVHSTNRRFTVSENVYPKASEGGETAHVAPNPSFPDMDP